MFKSVGGYIKVDHAYVILTFIYKYIYILKL